VIGTQIGKYKILAELGEGAMGSVYRAEDSQTGDLVAIKMLKPSLVQSNPELITRFAREGQALRDLNHPNIVALLDVIEENDQHFLVMEYVTGGDLASQIKTTPGGMPVSQALPIALDLADALTRAHRLNIIHRDLKPANVLLAQDGTPRLSDFGIAHFSNDGASSLTQEGAIVGTLAYISPEGCMGQPIDERADIWSFGVILFEMLTGGRPFAGDTTVSTITAILYTPLPDPQALRADIPAGISDLLYRMLDKNRESRIPSIRLVGAEIEGLIKGTSTPVPHPRQDTSAPHAPQKSIFQTPTPEPTAGKHNLPAQPTPFVGRETELAELKRLIADPQARLITLLGPGGMGKTRLSLETAAASVNQFEHGVFMVELAPLSHPAGIATAIAEVLEIKLVDGATPQDQVLNYLKNKNMLLLLDNFEHLIEGASIAGEILQHAPGVKVLATSRHKLNLSGESIFTIGGMEFPAWETPADAMRYSAVQLFLQSARRARVDFDLKENDLDFVARICKMVQGMPLGIVLAAAWVDTLPLAEIATEMARSVDFLESELQDLPERHRSMRAAFEYSWRLLGDEERDIFSKMAIFQGGFEREAAQQITGISIRMLTTLVNKSLLQRNLQSGRFGVHELLRQFAAETLDQSGHHDAVSEAHSRFYLAYLTERERDVKGRRQLPALDEIEIDFENVSLAWQDALRRSDAAAIGAALESLYWFTFYRGRKEAGADLLAAARQRWPDPGGAGAEALAGRLLVYYPPTEALEASYRRAMEIARQHDDPQAVAFAANELGRYLAHQLVDPPAGLALMDESLALYHTLGDDFAIGRVLDDLSFAHLYDSAALKLSLAEESLALRRRSGDRVGEGGVLMNLSVSYMQSHQISRAREMSHTAQAIAREMRDHANYAWHSMLLASHALLDGDIEESERLLQEAWPLMEDVNIPDLTIEVHLFKAMHLALSGDPDQALQMLRQTYPIESPFSMHTQQAYAAYSLTALVHHDDAELDRLARLMVGQAKSIGITDYESHSELLPFIAVLFLRQHKLEQAAHCFALANASLFASFIEVSKEITAAQAELESQLGADRLRQIAEQVTPEDTNPLVDEFLAGP
jgi:serine/threonine protein kinase